MKSTKKVPVVGDGTWAAVIPFALITSCFALWGFANDITTPLVKAFSKIFRMSVTEGTLVLALVQLKRKNEAMECFNKAKELGDDRAEGYIKKYK